MRQQIMKDPNLSEPPNSIHHLSHWLGGTDHSLTPRRHCCCVGSGCVSALACSSTLDSALRARCMRSSEVVRCTACWQLQVHDIIHASSTIDLNMYIVRAQPAGGDEAGTSIMPER
jgi:hypothetical protein